jgi:hypothetical protein
MSTRSLAATADATVVVSTTQASSAGDTAAASQTAAAAAAASQQLGGSATAAAAGASDGEPSLQILQQIEQLVQALAQGEQSVPCVHHNMTAFAQLAAAAD